MPFENRSPIRKHGLSTLAVCLWGLAALPATADTIVSGNITSNENWTTPGSPYVITTSVDVNAGVTLTIGPGVVVRFNSGTEINVYGRLVAEGTEADRILFTGATATAGSWEGINIYGTAGSPNVGSKFKYANIDFGGNYYANLYLYYATATLRNCAILNSSSDGITGGYGGLAHIYDTEFIGNSGYAVNFEDGSVDPTLRGLLAAGNTDDAVAIGDGTITGTHTWENCGIPYVVTGTIDINANATLYVRPGTTVRFENGVAITAYGRLIAAGTEPEPILFTGTTQTPGWWEGISVVGTASQTNAGSVFTYTTVEYGGGYYANIYVDEGQVAITRCVIRRSSNDGIYLWYGGISSTVERSQIVDNAGYAIQHNNAIDPANMLFAPHNWWGNASGPYHATCNPSGAGGQVTDGVAFTPFLTAPNQDPGPVAPADARMLSITPTVWFAPADGVTKIWAKITLRDGSGNPLPGRTVQLHSTVGTVVDGGITNFNGESLAYVTSTTPGDARLTATLQFTSTCESARSPSATVTFGSTGGGSDLMPDAAAPYMNDYMNVNPLPVTRGVATSITAVLTNPNPFPIGVDATISVADYGIGLTFGDIATITGQTIPANSNGTIAASWTPAVSGDYCIGMNYSASGSGSGSGWSSSGKSNYNLSVEPGALGSSGEKTALDRAERATGMMNHDGVTVGLNLVGGSPEGIPYQYIQSYLVGAHLNWMFSTARTISRALGGDPPRQDYKSFGVPPKPSVPPAQTTGTLTAARVAAINAFQNEMIDAIYYGRAATTAFDRYGGAAAAGDLTWASQQAAAMIYYKKEMGKKLLMTADRLEALLSLAQTEGFTDDVLTVQQVRAYQQQIATHGFHPTEINAAKTLGLTDAEIESIRQEMIAADPDDVTLSRVAYVNQLVQALRNLGEQLSNPPNFGTTGGSAVARASNGNKLARIFETASDFQVVNPLTSTANIELKVRRIDLPPDWMVDVRPTSATLAAGAQTTATVSVRAGTAAVQGTQPRVAVEAYAGSQMIGGIAIDVMVPKTAPFDSTTHAARWEPYE